MKKILFGLCMMFGCLNVYAGALDDLAASVATKKEQKVAQAKQEQQRVANLADCEQAIKKAKQWKRETGLKSFYIFEEGFYFFTDQGKFSGGITENIPTDSQYVSDFASDGVFIQGNDKFIYTKDKDYATGDKFRGKGLIYTKVGNYKYTTVTGATKSVPAFKATKYKASEMNYKAYLKNKKLQCCKTTEGEVGIDGRYIGECFTK